MHAPLAPSSAAVWVHCAGSVLMQAMYPQESTDDSRAGDAAHWVCSEALLSYTSPQLQSCNSFVNKDDPAGTVVTQEMADAAQVYVTHCLSVLNKEGGLQGMRVEQSVPCVRIHPSACFGTTDFALYSVESRTLYVSDFKFGFGYVDEYENWQMITYAVGLIDELGLDDLSTWVEMTVVQPRFYSGSPVRTWRVLASDLRAYANTLHTQGHKALEQGAECVSGPWCVNCTGRRACLAARQSGYWAMSVSTQPTPLALTPDALGVELMYINRSIKALEYMETALMEQTEVLLNNGVVVPGFAKQPTKGQRRWKMADELIIQIGNACGVDVRSPKALTPSKAESAGVDIEFINNQTERPTTMKVKPIKSNSIKKVFN